MAGTQLEQYRSRFLNQLHSAEFDGSGASDFLSYWQSIEFQAKASEDMGQLDSWVKDLARDKDRLAELKSRQQQASSSQLGGSEAIGLINRILALLDDIDAELKRRLRRLRDELGLWVILAGMGRKSKPVPKGIGKKKDDDDDDKESELLLAQKKKKPQPIKKMER